MLTSITGFTPRLLLPSEDVTLPARFNLGLVRIIPSFANSCFFFLHSIFLMQINLVDRPSTSQADLSAQEMASSVPALLSKIARFRPRVACFIGKGIWLHVERALKHLLPKSDDGAGDQNAGITLGAHSEGNVPMLEPATKTPVTATLKDGRSVYFPLGGDTPVVERPPKAEPERFVDSCGGIKLEENGTDFSSKQNTTTRRRSGVSSSRNEKAPPAPAFAYGLQPIKAVHDTVPHVRNPFHGLPVNLCLMISLI
jgi:hypothetical protein